MKRRLVFFFFFDAVLLAAWCGLPGADAFFEGFSVNVTSLPYTATFGNGDFHGPSSAFAYKCFAPASYNNLLVRVSDAAGTVRVAVSSNSAACESATVGVYRPNSGTGTEECVATSYFCPAQNNIGEIVFLAQSSVAYYFFVSTPTLYCDVTVNISTVTMTETGAETLDLSDSLDWNHTGNFNTEPHSPLIAFGSELMGFSSLYQRPAVPQGKLLEVHANVPGTVEVSVELTDPSLNSSFPVYLVITTPNTAIELETDVARYEFNVSSGDVFYVLATYVSKTNPIVAAPDGNLSYTMAFSFIADDQQWSSSPIESSSDINAESSSTAVEVSSSSTSAPVLDKDSSSSPTESTRSSSSSAAQNVRESSGESAADSALEKSSSSSVVHRKRGLSDIAIIGIAVAIVVAIVSGIIAALVVSSARSRKKKKKAVGVDQEAEMERITFRMVPAADLILPAAIASEEPPSDADSLPLEALPLRPSTVELTFGQQGEQAPVGLEISERVEMRNTTKSKQRFTFFLPASYKWRFEVSPKTAVVKRGGAVAVDIKLTFLCTTRLRESLRFTVQAEKKEPQRPLLGTIDVALDSKLSTRLDYDELNLFTPAIGEGSFGTVYKGTWRGAEVAVKVLKAAMLDQDESVLAEFMREMDIMRGLRSEFIVGFFGAVLVPGKLSLVTEFCPLGSLKSLMEKHPRISFVLRLRFAIDCARGMLFLHSNGILHRDLKPDNLLVVATNAKAPVVCKLTDFGTSRTMSTKAREEMTTGLGTPCYMAPEILLRQPYSTGADLYSYAILLYELYTQKQPFSGPEFARTWAITKFVCDGKRLPIPEECPLPYANTIASCWAVNPAERPGFESVLRDLNQLYESTIKKHRADVKLRRFQREGHEDEEDVAAAGDLGEDLEEEEVVEEHYRLRGLSILATQPAPAPVTIVADTAASTDGQQQQKAKTAMQ